MMSVATEESLEALDLPSPLSGERGACPRQVAKLANGLGRDERGPDEPVRTELGQPRGVGDNRSVLRPGIPFACRAFANISSNGPSSSR